MKARITNLSNKENEMSNWDICTPWLVSKERVLEETEWYREDLTEILNQFYLWLEQYPKALQDDVIYRKYEELRQYVKKKKVAIDHCYSYYHKEEKDNIKRGNMQNVVYGIRTLPDVGGPKNHCITITGYGSTASGYLLDKNQLNLKLNRQGIQYINWIKREAAGCHHIVKKEELMLIEPKIYTRTK